MRTKEEYKKRVRIAEATKKLGKQIGGKLFRVSAVTSSQKDQVLIVRIADVPQEFEGYQVRIMHGTIKT